MSGFFVDLGMPFPLFRAPIVDACVDDGGPCVICGADAPLRFDEACYVCLRAGKVDRTVDTEFGMVRPEDAVQGLTHGIPLRDPSELPDYELVPHPSDPMSPTRWYSVKLPVSELMELLRTPTFQTWQGERWLFCCRRPAVFIGAFALGSGDDEEVAKRVAEAFGVSQEEASRLRDEIEDDAIGTYSFECHTCKRMRAYFDRS